MEGTAIRLKIRSMLETVRYRLLTRLIRFWYWCEYWLENTPHRSWKTVLYEPISGTAILISLAISAASFGAQMIITRLMAPKPKPQEIGKLTGKIQLTDSIFGAEIFRIYGGRNNEAEQSSGGVEVGCNIHWMSDVRVIRTPEPGNTGGGKGGPDPEPNIRINYKVDIAGVVGAGRLRLLRMKWNDDTVYSLIGGGGGTGPTPIRHEAEDPANTLSGGATVAADIDCSGAEKVTGIGAGGVLIINDIEGDASGIVEIPDPGGNLRLYFNFLVYYKSNADLVYKVKLDDTGGSYTFPNTGGAVGTKAILRRVPIGVTHTLEFSHPTSTGLEVDCVDVTITALSANEGPTGIKDDDFPVETAQNNLLLPDPKDVDTNAFERYNGITPDAVAGAIEIPIAGGATLAWYEGTEDQDIDPVIEADITAKVGAGLTPAFLGTSFFRISDMDFTKYGTVPAIRCVVENVTTKKVDEILLVEGTHGGGVGGLAEGDLDLAAGEDYHCRGYVLAGNEPPAKAFEDLATWFNLAVTESHEGKIRLVNLNTRTPVATITRADLGAYIAGESDEVPLDDVVTTVPEESQDLIRTLEVQFFNPLAPSDYNTDRRSFNFPFTASQRKEALSFFITALPEEAEAVTRRELQKSHLKQAPDKTTTTHKYAWLDAGECINIEIDGEMHVRRIEEKMGSAPGVYELALTNEDISVLADDPDIEFGFPGTDPMPERAETIFPANTVGTIMDLPPMRDQDRGLTGVYVAACSKGTGSWPGCVVHRLKGVDYAPVVSLTKPAAIGRVIGTMDDIPPGTEGGGPEPDMVTEVTVDFFGDFNPTTVTEEQAIDGANPYLFGSELCGVIDWTRDNDYPNRWVGSTMLRGMKGTTKQAEIHQEGERVVLLNSAVVFVPMNPEEIAVERMWKFVTYGQEVADAAEIEFTAEGLNARVTAIADEAFTRGALVHLFDDGGILTARNADATDNTRPARGFVDVVAAPGDLVTIYFSGETVKGLEGLTPGADLYLSENPGGVTHTPITSGAGKIVQPVGTATSEAEFVFEPQEPVELAA